MVRVGKIKLTKGMPCNDKESEEEAVVVGQIWMVTSSLNSTQARIWNGAHEASAWRPLRLWVHGGLVRHVDTPSKPHGGYLQLVSRQSRKEVVSDWGVGAEEKVSEDNRGGEEETEVFGPRREA